MLIRPDVIWKKISRPLYHVHFTVIHTNSRHKLSKESDSWDLWLISQMDDELIFEILWKIFCYIISILMIPSSHNRSAVMAWYVQRCHKTCHYFDQLIYTQNHQASNKTGITLTLHHSDCVWAMSHGDPFGVDPLVVIIWMIILRNDWSPDEATAV